MIIFKKIRAKNFLSIGNIFLEYDLCSHQNTCYIGDSGAGKSSIEDLISFSLFNKSFRNINKGQLVNNVNKSECVVEIEFEINQKNYKIVRGIKPNLLKLYLDGVEVQYGSDMSELQEYIESHILKINYKSFIQTSIIAPAGFVSFMQQSIAQRKEIIENILDINIFSVMGENAKERFKLINNDLTAAQTDIKVLISETESQKRYIELIKKGVDDKTDEIKSKIGNETKRKSTLETELQTLIDNPSYGAAPIKDETLVSNERELNKKIAQHEQEINGIKKHLAFYEKHDDCPTCHQSIDPVYKENTLSESHKELEQHKVSITINKDLLHTNTKKLQAQRKLVEAYQQQKNSHESKCNGIKSSIREVERNIAQLNKELQVVKPVYDIDIENDKLKKIKQAGKELTKEIERLKNEKEIASVVNNLFKNDVLKKVILSKYIPIINSKINEYLKILELPVRFTFDESFNEKILASNQDGFTYTSFSSGERARIDLSIIFTLREISAIKNSITSNLLVIDEIFDGSLDNTSTENLMKILTKLTDNNVIVISHKSDVEDYFERTLNFKKVNGFTKYFER